MLYLSWVIPYEFGSLLTKSKHWSTKQTSSLYPFVPDMGSLKKSWDKTSRRVYKRVLQLNKADDNSHAYTNLLHLLS